MSDGTQASNGDTAPNQSPIKVNVSNLIEGSSIHFTVTGQVSNGTGLPYDGPDGGALTSHTTGAENGISDITAPVNSLIGVFLDDSQPDITSTPPPLNFSSIASRNFSSLIPSLKQPFFIGDGRTDLTETQGFIVPSNATRLFIGTMDGYGWFNNTGSFDVAYATSPPSNFGRKQLNDTGITKFGDTTNNNLTTEPANYPGQDASLGRDAAAQAGTLTKVGGGRAGFDFTKLDASGNTLPASAPTWVCVQDNVTGLMWEVKSNDGSLRDKDNTYTWFNPVPTTNGGDPGTQDGGTCTGSACDTNSYIQSTNSQGLCGYSDWRLPLLNELRSIADYSIPYPGPTIDTAYFPFTNGGIFWSASPYAPLSGYAMNMFFDHNGADWADVKSSSYHVRLVRNAQ